MQIFKRSTNTLARASIFGAVFVVAGVLFLFAMLDRSPLNTGQGVILEQPVPFSHLHHVSQLGIDCRYCHTSVEDEAFAGIPPTATCMNCHVQIWSDSEMLEPVRASLASGEPLRWNRVNDLPDYAYFNHSIHLAKGVGCVSCHGRVDQMPLMLQAETLQMEFCLECHREPERFLRPREHLFDLGWQPKRPQLEIGMELKGAYGVGERLDDCAFCHR